MHGEVITLTVETGSVHDSTRLLHFGFTESSIFLFNSERDLIYITLFSHRKYILEVVVVWSVDTHIRVRLLGYITYDEQL